MRRRLHFDSMVVRILVTVLSGIFIAILLVTAIIINVSENIFVDTYGKSQEQVFQRIENELNGFHEDLMKMTDTINSSWYLKMYLQNQIEDPSLEFQIAYKAKEDMDRAIPSEKNNFSVLALSKEGKSYVSKAERITIPVEEILASKAVKAAMEKPESVSYVFLEQGYTSTTKKSPTIMMVRALKSPGNKEAYGVTLVSMKEEELSRYYEYFTSENAEFYLVNKQGIIISSSEKEKLNAKLEETDSPMHTVLKKELPYYQLEAYGIINNEKALGDLYDVPQLWIVCLGIMLTAAVVIVILVKQTTSPLSKVIKQMSNAKKVRFDEHMKLGGTWEVKELEITYNSMIDDLNRYIEELMAIQKEKRKAEISALQMQINPHYIYNTLASIKWLIFQGETEKSVKTIDAFIALLRNTISNTDEYITVEQEIENLKNYVLINNTRYGDKVQVEYFVTFGCEEYKIPKMLLQPFVENAFFHAFPCERQGNIQILVRKTGKNLQIQVADDGVGMKQDRLAGLMDKDSKKEHFSGIGINNVDDRLRLIYGEKYGIQIESEENRGTTITLLIPLEE